MADPVKRLHGPALLTAGALTKVTADTGSRTHITRIIVANVTGTAATFFLSIGADAAGTRLYPGVTIPPLTMISDEAATPNGEIPLLPGEIVQAYSGTNAALVLTIIGREDN